MQQSNTIITYKTKTQKKYKITTRKVGQQGENKDHKILVVKHDEFEKKNQIKSK